MLFEKIAALGAGVWIVPVADAVAGGDGATEFEIDPAVALSAGESEAIQGGLKSGSGFGPWLFVEKAGAFEAVSCFAGWHWREFGHFEPGYRVVQVFAVAAEDGLDLNGKAFVSASGDLCAKGASGTFEKIGAAHDESLLCSAS